MNRIMMTTIVTLFFAAAVNAQQARNKQVAPANQTITQQPAAKAKANNTYPDKEKRADERAKATASINAVKSATPNAYYSDKANTAKPVTEIKTPVPTVHSVAYNKRTDERAGRNTPKDWGKMKSPVAGKK